VFLGAEVPVRMELSQNIPNPFNPSTTITFAVPGAYDVETRLEIYDIRGRKITTLTSGSFTPGWYEVTWDGSDSRGVPSGSGVYIYLLRVGDQVTTRKMTLLR